MSQSTSKDSFRCHCADSRFKNGHFIVDDVRKKVCRDLPFYRELDGKEYCVLHYPGQDKIDDFTSVFEERIQENEWDFGMVYFPKAILYENEEFHKNINFSHATFTERLIFQSCTFWGLFNCFDSIFLDDASFFCEFHKQVNFNSADFQEHAGFSGAKFHEESFPSFNRTKFKTSSFFTSRFNSQTEFKKAIFIGSADFSRTEFKSKVDFSGMLLPEGKQTTFSFAKFHETVIFDGVNFYETDFYDCEFAIDSKSNFSKIVFTNCIFAGRINFSNVKFYSISDFSKSTFQVADFSHSTFASTAYFKESFFFDDVFFNSTKFGYKDGSRIQSSEANFSGAEFRENSRVFFDNTWFSWHTNFDSVKFGGHVFFIGNETNPVFDIIFETHAFGNLLKIPNATFEKPEKVYFHTVRLRPSWFVNLFFDLRKCNLVNIEWSDETRRPITIEGELRNLGEKFRNIDSKKLLIIVFRQLAENAETNSRFEESSNFRRMAFETERLLRKEKQDKWWQEGICCPQFFFRVWGKLKTLPYDLAHGLYRISSFYGESSMQAFKILVIIIFTSALLYLTPLCKFDKEKPRSLTVSETIPYSLRIMLLQRPEPQPENDFAKWIVTLESVFAPLQVALLALALRRKFMR